MDFLTNLLYTFLLLTKKYMKELHMIKYKIGVDIDGTLSTIKQSDQTYADVKMLPGADKALKELKDAGHEIILYTARHMQSCGHNVGLVTKRVGSITTNWLKQNNITYDQIFFGKPNANITIAPNVIRFFEWNKINLQQIEKAAAKKIYLEEFDSGYKNDITKIADRLNLRICFYLDGVICEADENVPYEDRAILPGAKEVISELKNKGHEIIIATSRNYGSSDEDVCGITEDWLNENNIIYDEIFFNQPSFDVGIDDRTIMFMNWDSLTADDIEKNARER